MKLAQNSDLCSIFAFNEQEQIILSNPSIAYAYYKDHRIDLNSGVKEKYDLDQLGKHLLEIKVKQSYECPYVLHLFYELGFYFVGMSEFIGDNQLLAIELQYQEVDQYVGAKGAFDCKKISSPHYSDYQKAFARGYENLLQGNCYQFNLTAPYDFEVGNTNLDHAISFFWDKMTPAYAHATQIPLLNRQFISNSPECLFQMRKNTNGYDLWTMPIKGTVRFDKGDDFKLKWRELSQCKKNGAELDMISDLLRNDLCAIDLPAAKILKRKAPLVVPSILHQYSLISVDLPASISLGKILSSLFPGGSITGAPKRRVMEILRQLENRARGFYCGSTVLFYKNIRAASINIRSLEIDVSERNLRYQAGGGVTLMSQCEQEFCEMELKVDSFFGCGENRSQVNKGNFTC